MPVRPNILFIMDDQHRHDFLGCAGADFIQTPHIDSLAERGMVFTHCCTNAPVCGPARIALATGLLPTRTGTVSNHTSFMPLSTPNHYRHFRDNGYRVEVVGRHDLAKPGAPGSVYGTRPLNASYGFTRALEIDGIMSSALKAAKQGATGPYTSHLQEAGLLDAFRADYVERSGKGWIIGASHDWPLAEEHHPDVFTCRRAVERIENIEDDYPWYMLVSFHSPHDPYAPPSRLGDQYRDADIPDPIPPNMEGRPRRIRDRYERLYSHATAEDIRVARRQYCAKVALIDEQVGRLMDALAARGVLDSTIVVFASDHGDHVGDHGLFIKHTAYEPSLRVPLVISGPTINAGRSDALVELFDLNPTLVELAGLAPQPNLDARSFAPLLRGESGTHRPHCFACEDGYRAVRTPEHKYIETLNDTPELYDLAADPGERFNILGEQPKRVTELRQVMLHRMTSEQWRH